MAGDVRCDYPRHLRAIGAALDAAGAACISVIELPTQFVVRDQRPAREQRSQVIAVHGIDDRPVVLWDTPRVQRSGLFARLRSGEDQYLYRDLLDAVGRELQAVEAYALLIDEVDDGLLVTCQILQPEEGYQPRKRMVVLDEAAQAALRHTAQGRRTDAHVKRLFAGPR